MSSYSHYHVYSLPLELLDTLTPRNLINTPQSAEPPKPESTEPISSTTSGARTCNVCTGASFVSLDEQRAHFRSDWHRYNVKTRLAGGSSVTESAFSQLVEALEDSLSGSESSSDEDNSSESDAVSNLISRTKLKDRSLSPDGDRTRNIPQTALSWFHSPPSTQFGVYRALYSDPKDAPNYLEELRGMQEPCEEGRTWAMFMVAGGHFAGAIVRVSRPAEDEVEVVKGKSKKPPKPKPDTEVLRHKTFHRYTTRRKQGGSQSLNDNAKGNAKSAGALLRRYGEQSLRDDIRNLISEWSEEINACERIWIRASGSNRKIFMGYDDAIISKGDDRLRTFPFPTRRPTQSELARCLLELTRVKVTHFTEEILREQDEAYLQSLPKPKPVPAVSAPAPEPAKPKPVKLSKEEELLREKWSRLLEMITKGRLEPFKAFWERESPVIGPIDVRIPDWTGERRATLLQVAVQSGHEDLTQWLLEEARADPTIPVPNRKFDDPDDVDDGPNQSDSSDVLQVLPKGSRRTAYDLARTKGVRDVFRRCAASHPDWWDWLGAGRVPSVLSQQMEQEQEEKKKGRRKGLKDKVKEREARDREKEKEQPPPPVHVEPPKAVPQSNSASRRLGGSSGAGEGVTGLTPEMRAKVERERRARAAEARMKALGSRLSLKQQLALLEEAAPVDFDPEDAQARDFDNENGVVVDPTAREHYFDVGPSSLRKQHDSISDPKYEGIKTTRKMLQDDSDGSLDEGSELEEDDLPDTNMPETDDDEGDEFSDDDRDNQSGEEEDEEDEEEAHVPPPSAKVPVKRPVEEDERGDDLSTELVKKREEDKKKGKAVSRQIALWDSLLDARIRIQKAVTAANRLPPPLDLKTCVDLPDCQDSLNNLLKEAALFSEEVFQLQEKLLETNETISAPPRKRQKLQIDDETTVDYAQWLEDATEDASALEEVYHPHLVQTLAKWSSKIQAVAPSVLLPSNRGAFSSKGSQHTKTVLQLIDEALADNNKLLGRTQVRRNKGSRIGVPEATEDEGVQEDPNVFDDTDFYQQMLRDIIDSKGQGSGGGDDWMSIQKQKKAKKKVDTKASKGRKLRYEAHEKLQNFMVPVPVIGGWHEEQIDELFSSLLGKGLEGLVTGEDGLDGQQEEVQLNEALKGGFRVTPPWHNFKATRSHLLPPLIMDTFEDENPFEQDTEHISSETSSTTRVDFSAPSSPPPSAQQLAPTSPLSRPFPSPGSHRHQQANFKADFCCVRDRYLHSGEDVEILITDAQKTTGTAQAHHRYSEFESLRANLVKLYPTLIIPPIPSKQTIGDYAVKQGKAKEDTIMIARRKRMLQTFLNRIARHPILSNEHVFHRFLDGEVSWTEVLNSPPLSLLPKNILKAPSHNPTDQNASPAYAALPNPSAAHPLRHPDQRFADSEAFTNKFANHVGGPMDKVTRRAVKRWSEYGQDHADLGAALNGFSLNEHGALSGAIEKVGQAADATYMSTSKLLQELEQNWAEPLHEYSQFASIIKKLLAYRHQKHVQYEMTQDGLESKREQLEDLEKSEREARRLEEALSRGKANLNSGQPAQSPVEGAEENHEAEAEQPQEEVASPSSYVPPHPGPNPARRRTRAPGMGFLNALSYTLHGMMDVDPETARRNSITKTRESISQVKPQIDIVVVKTDFPPQLEDALHLAAQDLKYSSSTIQADLDRFQRQKVADLREMAISMARSHRDWCQKNLEVWEEAKKEIAKIPDHPNHLPPTSQEPAKEAVTPSGLRRDSTATINGR
ncbi:hypothetical protein H0H92_006772 [Tricholoma furcatifolium]|nr:hypothetical protein H0H92_006772 [Tricholoma furcatifolium]